jgi:GntR family transcriptional regulator
MFELDFKSRLPIYEQLCRMITQMAALGALDPAEPLPSVRNLARQLGINPNTVQKAYQMLEHDGIINTVPGKGSFPSGDGAAVAHRRLLAVEKLEEALREAAQCGVPPETVEKLTAELFTRREKDD